MNASGTREAKCQVHTIAGNGDNPCVKRAPAAVSNTDHESSGHKQDKQYDHVQIMPTPLRNGETSQNKVPAKDADPVQQDAGTGAKTWPPGTADRPGGKRVTERNRRINASEFDLDEG